ncbi:MAG TPA: prephenate dehydrogenase/arogenate dehydrogenase family protein [Burkholderiales bacterium]|nr:prephenate dehydrogenase/arogenate dehydrogenase family protein [Burkholderiales bacterium]
MKLAVIGVGLIGGSFALALKEARLVTHVAGAGRSAANLRLALERGAIDSIAPDAAGASRDADVVLVAAPVAQFAEIFSSLKLKRDAIVTDAGSTKRDVIAAARRALGARIAQFVPGHPIAGGEKSGAAAASAELFRNRRVLLTPLAENTGEAVARVESLWQGCGAKVSRMGAEEHDAVLAAVSHLPHVLAYALVHEMATRPDAAQLFSFAAGGFRDFTRIASSHPEMWRDICVANRDRLVFEIGKYEAELRAVKALVAAGDGPALERLFAEAREAREQWLKRSS